jgi:hypothetical protein
VDNLPQEAIGERLNLRAGEISPSKEAGIFNAIYLVGSEHVLRVPREAPPFVDAIRKESVAVPVARAAGVRCGSKWAATSPDCTREWTRTGR